MLFGIDANELSPLSWILVGVGWGMSLNRLPFRCTSIRIFQQKPETNSHKKELSTLSLQWMTSSKEVLERWEDRVAGSFHSREQCHTFIVDRRRLSSGLATNSFSLYWIYFYYLNAKTINITGLTCRVWLKRYGTNLFFLEWEGNFCWIRRVPHYISLASS